MGVEIRLSQRMDREGWFNYLGRGFDAVYVGTDGWADGKALHLPQLTVVDQETLAASTKGVFLGGKEKYTPIEAVAEGRKAATSIDRHLQSLPHGRQGTGRPIRDEAFHEPRRGRASP